MYVGEIIYGIGVEIGVRDVWIFDEYKKETSTPLEQQLYGNKPISLYRILLYLMINVNCIRRSRRNMTSSCTSMVSEV